MVNLDDFLNPFEKIIWRGKPDKKAMVLSAFFGSVPWALLFFALFLGMLYLRTNLTPFPLFVLAIAVGIIVIPPLMQLRKYPNAEYMLTNQRLLVKDGLTKDDVLTVRFEIIKEIIIKKGITGKILGTGNISPIIDSVPYSSRHLYYARAGLNCLKEPYKIYKILKEEIFNYVNCDYCLYRYDLNKEERCPKCGTTHQKSD